MRPSRGEVPDPLEPRAFENRAGKAVILDNHVGRHAVAVALGIGEQGLGLAWRWCCYLSAARPRPARTGLQSQGIRPTALSSPETRAYRAAIFMIVSYVVGSRRDLVRPIGHQDRVGVLELGGEQAIEGVIEVNGGSRA